MVSEKRERGREREREGRREREREREREGEGGREREGGREGEREDFFILCFSLSFSYTCIVSLNRHHSGSSMSNTPAPSGGGASVSGSLPPSVARSTSSSSKVSHTYIN